MTWRWARGFADRGEGRTADDVSRVVERPDGLEVVIDALVAKVGQQVEITAGRPEHAWLVVEGRRRAPSGRWPPGGRLVCTSYPVPAYTTDVASWRDLDAAATTIAKDPYKGGRVPYGVCVIVARDVVEDVAGLLATHDADLTERLFLLAAHHDPAEILAALPPTLAAELEIVSKRNEIGNGPSRLVISLARRAWQDRR